ncbi:RNA polymerase sigma factor [Sandaracinobacter sp. RS1-74]|uniref:RNA polymerase sigma factor n=1 Tax=Sandaracinobacteroides sayramensis TaxID=2913411 RepID=UPI001EDABCAF|nr:RNA polymerase sigma factor [Sandaracinobacteroides sayramensis]MCG2840266.1 RNA polymerase sigma factor [Sandaracinobacteroides sayramensis]
MPTNSIALSRLLLAERTSLIRRIRRLVGSEGAEDVVQKIWLRIQAVRDDPPIDNPRAYLRRLAHNVAVDHVQADKRRRDVHAEATALLHEGVEQISGERILLARDELMRVETAIAALPATTRRIFLLSRVDGMAQREIAAHVGVSRPTVEKHLRRAFDAVTAALERQP